MGFLIAGVVTSRLGLWMFDLSVSQMLQERVDPDVRLPCLVPHAWYPDVRCHGLNRLPVFHLCMPGEVEPLLSTG